jgi:outer membrane lipopolysaccharide assembly protein LptE/RlpB
VRRALVAVAAVTLLTGCGYTFRGTLPEHIKTISVPIFVNRTQEPGVESIVTRAVVEGFSTNGRLRVVRTAGADAVLEGEVTSYGVQAIAFDKTSNVQQYRLVVILNLRLRDLKKNAVLFQQTGVYEQADFRALGPVDQTIAREETALRAAATEIGRSVVSLVIDRF